MENVLKLFKEKPYLPLLALLGILLLLFGTQSGGKKTESNPGNAASQAAETYRANLREEAETLCRKVCGDEVYVVLTLESTQSTVYARDTDGVRETVVKAGSSPVIEGYTPPQVAGVAVVCRGGERPEVRQELTDLLRAALHIPASKIRVSGISLF
ncbi:MAG: hypothetical protein MJ078_01260 [Clostridia bacterium]|nr:hypothetical protein [Clostridia bacterium]